MKPEFRSEAVRREETSIRFTPWKDGKPQSKYFQSQLFWLMKPDPFTSEIIDLWAFVLQSSSTIIMSLFIIRECDEFHVTPTVTSVMFCVKPLHLVSEINWCLFELAVITKSQNSDYVLYLLGKICLVHKGELLG